VIWHDHESMELNSVFVVPEAMLQDEVAGVLRQWYAGAGAEGDKECCVILLQMREAAAIAVLASGGLDIGLCQRLLSVWGRAPSPAKPFAA